MSVPDRVCTCILCHWYSLPSSPSSLECSPCCSRRLWVPGYRTLWRSWNICEHLVLRPVEGRLQQQMDFGASCKELAAISSRSSFAGTARSRSRRAEQITMFTTLGQKDYNMTKDPGFLQDFPMYSEHMWEQFSPPEWFSDADSGWHWHQRENYGGTWGPENSVDTRQDVVVRNYWMQLSFFLPSCCSSSNTKISHLEIPSSVLGSLLPVLQSLPVITINCNFLICLVQNENKPLQSNTSRSGLFSLCMNLVHKGMTKNEFFFTCLMLPVAGDINNTQIHMKCTS